MNLVTTTPNPPPNPGHVIGSIEPPSIAPKRGRGRPPGFKGTANREIDYTCMTCNEVKPRDQLLARRVTWFEMGRAGKAVRSRTTGWQCRSCAEKDGDWQRDPLADSPGFKGTSIAKP
jgi:hypothetical protein